MELRRGAEFDVRTELEMDQGKRLLLFDVFIIDILDHGYWNIDYLFVLELTILF